MKRFLCLTIAFLMLLSVVPALAEETLEVFINGEKMDFTTLDGFIPVRAYTMAVGATVEWDNTNRCVVINDGSEIVIPIGEKWVQRAGLKKSIETESIIVNDLSYMPFDALKAFNAAYTVEDGCVKIVSSVFDGKYVKITNNGRALSSDEGGGNIVMAEISEDDSQQWKFSSRGSNVYRLENKKTQKAIDVPSDSKDAGKVLIQYAKTGGGNQNYVPVKNDDGTYFIQCYNSKLYMTIGEDGTISQEELTGKENQKFTLEVVGLGETTSDSIAPDTKIDPYGDKYWTILHDGKALAQNHAWNTFGRIVALEPEMSREQVWHFMQEDENCYSMVTKINQEDPAARDVCGLSYMRVYQNEDGKIAFMSIRGEVLTYSDGIYVISPNASLEDNYIFDIVKPHMSIDMYENADNVGGKYVVLSMDGKNLAVEGATSDNGAKICLDKTDGDEAVWAFVALGENKYTLINKLSGKAIDVPNESKEAGIQLSQYTSNNKNHQVYTLEKADGGVRLKNKNSGMYLTIKDGYAYQEEKSDSGQVFTYEIVGDSPIRMIGATATPFVLKGDEAVTNVKLQWSEVNGAGEYDIYRSVDGGEFEFLTSLAGITVDDYDLEVGKTYTYRVYALSNGSLIDYAETKAFTPYEMPLDMQSSTNLEPSGFSTPGGGMRDKDGVYYRFSQTGRKDGGKGFGQVTVSTSVDGVTYTEPKVIMTIDDILAHETCKDIEDIRFESVNFKYNPKANNFGFIAHAEKGSGGYDFARISVATYTPGDEKMVFHGAVRPGGDDVRDLNTFIDDDGTGYIMGATHNNADLAIYRLKDDWSGVEKRIALINQGAWRELPNILKVDGYYYLFTSGCAGWYPTPGMYNSATNMEGPWSELRNVGNMTTFSSQSGYGFFLKKDSENYIMNSYRWMSYWKDATLKTTQSLRFPITVSDGYAFYDYFEELLYNWDEDVLVPVQRGRILSQGKTASWGMLGSTIRGGAANDGNYKSQWTVDTQWPYSWEVDLGQSYNVNQVQISWRIHNGSEAYYQYIIEGSEDGVNYTTLVDRREGYTDYGFTVDNCMGKARFVKITVTNAKPRSGENNYPSSFYEIKVMGR